MPPFLLEVNMRKDTVTVTKEIDRYNIGDMCRSFRKVKLGYTLKQMDELTGYDYHTISAFEHGKSSNMLLLLSYYSLAKNEEQKDYFIHRLFDVL